MVGLIGLWKLATVFPSTRARIAALVVYAASPLVSGAFGTGSLDVLVAFAAVPWVVHTLRRSVGVETADPRTAHMDVADGLVMLSWPERLRRTMQFGIVVALATAFEPVVVVICLIVGVLLAVGTLLALAPWRTAVRYLGVTVVGTVVAALLNIPWITSWSWDALVGPPPIGDPGRGVRALASFEIGPTDFVSLSLALYLPVVAALLLARAWRLTWAVRAGVLVVGFGALAVFGDQDRLPFAAPEAGLLLVPVAVGLGHLGRGVVGGVRSRRPWWLVRLATATRARGERRRRGRAWSPASSPSRPAIGTCRRHRLLDSSKRSFRRFPRTARATTTCC